MRMRFLLVCVFAVGLVSSCDRQMIEETSSLRFTEIRWDVPFAGDVVFGGPLLAALVDSDTLLCLYRVGDEAEEMCSEVCFVSLSTGLCRWLHFPYGAAVKRISPDEIAVKPALGQAARESTWSFVDVASLEKHTGPTIPHGPYFHMDGLDAVLTNKNENDVWLYDRAAKQEYTLPLSTHGLDEKVYLALAPGRIVLTGRKGDYDDFPRPRTQLWTLPELRKVGDYQAIGEWFWYAEPEVFDDLFAYPLAPGMLQVASLRDGEHRFVLGQPPATPEAAHERNGGIAVVRDTSGYVRETGVILTVEQTIRNRVTLNAYDVATGRKVRTVPIQSKRLDDLSLPMNNLKVKVAKVGGEWVLFEQLTDPHDNPEKERCLMHLIPYRIRDFEKANSSIDFAWDCFLKPIIDNGRLIVPGRDHVRVCSLAETVVFGERETKAGNPPK